MEKFGPWNFSVWILWAFEIAKISQFLKLTIFKIFAKSAKKFFYKNFYFLMNFRTSFTSYRENRTVFRPKKCIFCKTNFTGEEKSRKSWFLPSFFFKCPKKAVKSWNVMIFYIFIQFYHPKSGGKPLSVFLLFQKLRFRVF